MQMLTRFKAWLRLKRLHAQLEEELQCHLDLHTDLELVLEHMMLTEQNIALLKEQIDLVKGCKIETPSTQENDHATCSRNVEEGIAEEHTH